MALTDVHALVQTESGESPPIDPADATSFSRPAENSLVATFPPSAAADHYVKNIQLTGDRFVFDHPDNAQHYPTGVHVLALSTMRSVVATTRSKAQYTFDETLFGLYHDGQYEGPMMNVEGHRIVYYHRNTIGRPNDKPLIWRPWYFSLSNGGSTLTPVYDRVNYGKAPFFAPIMVFDASVDPQAVTLTWTHGNPFGGSNTITLTDHLGGTVADGRLEAIDAFVNHYSLDH